MSHYTVHPTTDGRWQISGGTAPLLVAGTQAIANKLAATLNAANGQNPINNLPAELRPLAIFLIQLLKGSNMAAPDTTALKAIAATFATTAAAVAPAVAAAIPVLSNPAADTAAQADITAAVATLTDANAAVASGLKSLSDAVAAATAAPATLPGT